MTMFSERAIAAMHATLVSVSNATLTAIEVPGALGRNGDPGAPVPAWTGSARCFLCGTTRSQLDGDVETREETDSLQVYHASGAAVGLLRAGADWTASTVVVTDERVPVPVVRRYTVIGLERDADGTLDSITLLLNAGRTAT